jgi:transcriptional regulator with XRE-family HTH domain
VKRGHHVPGPDTDLQKRLGSFIRSCRHNLGITQEELAWRANIHRTYLADVERGARNVTLRTVVNLAKALHVTVANLFAVATTSPGTVVRTGSRPAPSAAREILLVEQNATDAAMMARAFKRAHPANPLRIVRNGEAGLDYLFGTGRYAKRKPPQPILILLNLDLPKMSGLEFLKRLKGDKSIRKIPVVLLKVLH